MSKSEAAKQLGVSVSYVDKMLREGRLPHFVCGSLGRLIDEDAVQALRRQREKEGKVKIADKS
jgi:excisionase family DNA binding protein